jgi:uncharacterized protein YdhG (YjbR/CyaY superfamily)
MKKVRFTTVDEYIALQPEEIQKQLEHLRKVVKKAVPESEECISYSMGAFRCNGILGWIGVFKKHYSLLVRPKVMDPFRDQLIGYTLTKSAIQIPFNKRLPDKLVAQLMKRALEVNLEGKTLKKKA